jgi:positive phototaxis protein PixI
MDSSQIAPPTERGKKPLGDSYLGFYINPQTPALLLMEYAQEIIIVPLNRITPMPNMPGCVLGLLNRRSRILWVVNLAQLLNLPATDPTAQQYQIIIIHVGQIKLGLVVQSVKGVTHFPPHSSQIPVNLSSSLTPYVSKCIPQENEMLMVLDVEKIASSPNLQRY